MARTLGVEDPAPSLDHVTDLLGNTESLTAPGMSSTPPTTAGSLEG
ncbi:hypothetical protein GCM10010441_72440 [Kitasatospora paracochleata]